MRAAHPADVGGDGGDRLKNLIPGSVDRLGRELKRTTASSRKRRAHCLGNSPSRSARSASSSNSGGDSSRPDSPQSRRHGGQVGSMGVQVGFAGRFRQPPWLRIACHVRFKYAFLQVNRPKV